MTYYWGTTWGNGQHSDAFWPTVDPYRLPGTTVSRKPLPDATGPAWGGLIPPNNWAGGAGDGEFSIVGHNCQGAQSTLQSKKSWVCLDDAVVCLGAGISSTDGYAVGSIVDNKNLGSGTGTHAFLVNGTAQNIATITLTWERPVSGVVSADPTVTVVQTGSQLRLRFNTSGAAGRTHKATVTLA